MDEAVRNFSGQFPTRAASGTAIAAVRQPSPPLRSHKGQDAHLHRVDLILDGRQRAVNVLAPAHVALDRGETTALASGERLGRRLPRRLALGSNRLQLGWPAGKQKKVGSSLSCSFAIVREYEYEASVREMEGSAIDALPSPTRAGREMGTAAGRAISEMEEL